MDNIDTNIHALPTTPDSQTNACFWDQIYNIESVSARIRTWLTWVAVTISRAGVDGQAVYITHAVWLHKPSSYHSPKTYSYFHGHFPHECPYTRLETKTNAIKWKNDYIVWASLLALALANVLPRNNSKRDSNASYSPVWVSVATLLPRQVHNILDRRSTV